MTPAPRTHPAYLRFAIGTLLLTLALSPWLVQLARFALKSDLYSHTILIPFVSAWLVWTRRPGSLAIDRGDPLGAGIAGVLACLALVVAFLVEGPDGKPPHVLTWTVTAYAAGLVAVAFGAFGRRFMRTNFVAAAFLLFMIPMPPVVEVATEAVLQRASAEAAQVFYSLSGLPFLRDGQVFALPGISLEIAQECSGIHSSLVLFMVSIVAGQLLLPPGWKRWALTLFVLPLAVVRNGFRVWVLGELCVRIGPHMIHHWIHHHGGPIFFTLSLIPFFAFLLLLQRVGRARNVAVVPPQAASDGA